MHPCLAEPLKPQYEGGIINNPGFNSGLNGWSKFGDGEIEERNSKEGNTFAVAHTRNNSYDSFSQKLYMHKGKHYTFSAWIQVSEGKEPVSAIVKTRRGYKNVGTIVAESGCWSMLKGGLTVNSSGLAKLYFESKNTSVEIWVDSVSLQPFTKEQWRSHQDQNIEKIRKKKVRIHAIDSQGKVLAGAKVSIKQNTAAFPFGSAINNEILNNQAYQNWFTSRFTVTVFENEMKWYSNEKTRGKVDYSVSDAMLNFAKQHGIAVRGHNILWDDPTYQPSWVKSLPTDELRQAADQRVNSVVSKYAGQVIHWDVVNENLHHSFFEDKLGKNFSAAVFQNTHQLDPKATLFLNDFSTIESSGDAKAAPSVYLQKLREIQSYGGNKAQVIGIGLEGHFKEPNIPYMRSGIDTLAATGMPIWLTEVDVNQSPDTAHYLEEILREAHSHPAVQGIILWTAWHPNGCWRMCLTDNNFKNLPQGDVVDKLIQEWKTHGEGITDSNGFFETSLFHGDYDVKISHPTTNSSLARSFKVTKAESTQGTTLHVQLNGI
ncbi:hypothetical protein IFM89_016680 [Coptis chinensis]|uniref:GH10 domain-containing protein n=1 Tax=Coptis chinensis TaxID=261450 RepID=A0A835IP09_9MAGN|nr:hypothetical protein IFM89_016680 [Coptis chinensis]